MDKKIKRNSKYFAVFMCFMLLLTFFGCEQQNDSIKNEVASLEGTDSSVSGEAEKGDVGKLKKKLHIPEKLQMDVLSNDGKQGYQVNGNVDVPIETNPAVYRQKKRSFTKEEIIKRAEKVFDSGEYAYVKPLDCYMLEELREEAAKMQKAIENDNTKDSDYYWHRKEDVETYVEFFKKSEVKEYREGDFSEGTKLASYDKIMIMEGKIGGEAYDLLAFTSNGHNYLKLCRQDAGYSLTNTNAYFGYNHKEEIADVIQGEDSDSTIQEDGEEEEAHIYRSLINELEPTQAIRKQYGDNQCKLSEEEAAKLALQYAALFGDEDMVIAKTNWCFLSNQLAYIMQHPDEETYSFGAEAPNAYAFYLQHQYGKLPCNESNFWWREATDMKEEIARKTDPSGIVAEQEDYRVEVTDEGVVSIDTIEPWYEIAETLSESTSLMDFSEIEELAKGYFTETVEGIETNKYTEKNITRISEVALRYATVLYDGEYTLIPCWFFNESDGTMGGMSTVMVINAIDGSKVYLHEEIR